MRDDFLKTGCNQKGMRVGPDRWLYGARGYQGDEGGRLSGLGGLVDDYHPVAPELQVVQVTSAGTGSSHHLCIIRE